MLSGSELGVVRAAVRDWHEQTGSLLSRTLLVRLDLKHREQMYEWRTYIEAVDAIGGYHNE
jgi:hypothetical protein